MIKPYILLLFFFHVCWCWCFFFSLFKAANILILILFIDFICCLWTHWIDQHFFVSIFLNSVFFMLLHFFFVVHIFNHTAILKRFAKINRNQNRRSFWRFIFLATAFKIDVKLCRECAIAAVHMWKIERKKIKITDTIGNQIGKEF